MKRHASRQLARARPARGCYQPDQRPVRGDLDGQVRAVQVHNVPDTFFTIPARCRIGGTTVTGYITIRDMDYTTYTHLDPTVVFHGGFNGKEMP